MARRRRHQILGFILKWLHISFFFFFFCRRRNSLLLNRKKKLQISPDSISHKDTFMNHPESTQTQAFTSGEGAWVSLPPPSPKWRDGS